VDVSEGRESSDFAGNRAAILWDTYLNVGVRLDFDGCDTGRS